MESVGMMVVCREIFQDVLDMENSIELYRKELAMKYDFTLGAFYNLFTRNALYKINLDEFLSGLDRLDIRLSAEEGDLFMSRYDSDLDGKLSFWELCNSLLPYDIRLRDDMEKKCQTLEMSAETRKMI